MGRWRKQIVVGKPVSWHTVKGFKDGQPIRKDPDHRIIAEMIAEGERNFKKNHGGEK